MSSVSGIGNAGVQKLEEAAKKPEVEIGIDLGADRFVQWIGVYLFLAIAVVIKVFDAVETNILCFPTNSSLTIDGQIMTYASLYCWETSPTSVSGSCISYLPTLQNPRILKEFKQWFPYFLLFQAFAFLMPWAYWRFRFGPRVIGHLKFMQLLLENIFENLKLIETPVYYFGEPYDEKSRQFDGNRLYDDPSNDNQVEDISSCCGSFVGMFRDVFSTPADSRAGVSASHIDVESGASEMVHLKKQNSSVSVGQVGPSSSSQDENQKSLHLSCIDKVIVGEMRDRHLFSMFCYENFVHLPHLPYILSVFQLTEASKQEKTFHPGYYFLDQGMLCLWTDNRNMQNTLLIKKYCLKHIFTAVMAFIMVVFMVAVAVLVYDDVMSADTFLCQLNYEDICMLCTFRRKRDLYAFFMVDMILTFIIFCFSLRHWMKIRNSSRVTNSHYFDELKRTSNIGLMQAYEAKMSKKSS